MTFAKLSIRTLQVVGRLVQLAISFSILLISAVAMGAAFISAWVGYFLYTPAWAGFFIGIILGISLAAVAQHVYAGAFGTTLLRICKSSSFAIAKSEQRINALLTPKVMARAEPSALIGMVPEA